MNLRMLVVGQFIDGKCFLHILLWSLEGGWHTENLSKLAFITAVSIVIYTVGSYHYFGYVEVDVSASSHTRRDNEVWVIVVNHFHRSDGAVHLSDAALLHHHLVFADFSDDEVLMILSLCLRFCQ